MTSSAALVTERGAAQSGAGRRRRGLL